MHLGSPSWGMCRFFSLPCTRNPEKPRGTKKLLFPGDVLECLSAMSMPLADLLFLAFALSVDAFVVAFSYGLLIKPKTFEQRNQAFPLHRGGTIPDARAWLPAHGNRAPVHCGLGPLAGLCRLHLPGGQRHPRGLEPPQRRRADAPRHQPDAAHSSGRGNCHQHRRAGGRASASISPPPSAAPPPPSTPFFFPPPPSASPPSCARRQASS